MRLGILHRQVRPRRPRPVHLVAALRTLPPEGKVRLVARVVADVAVQHLDRVGGDRDAVAVKVDVQHQIREHQRVRAAPRLVAGLAHRPAGVAHRERHRRLALDVHRLVELHLNADVLALAVGVRLPAVPPPQPGRRDHADVFDPRHVRPRVHLVVRERTDPAMVQPRVAADLAVLNPCPGSEPQRVGTDPHAVAVAVERLHLVLEMHVPGATDLRGIGSRVLLPREAREHGLHRVAGPPAGIVETDLQPQSPVWFQLHRHAERHREHDRLVQAVGVPRLRLGRDHHRSDVGVVVADGDGVRGRRLHTGFDPEHDSLVRLGFLVVDDADLEGTLRHPGRAGRVAGERRGQQSLKQH